MSTRDSRRYVPALRFHLLTGVYDPVVRWTTREATFKRRLIAQAAPAARSRVLDLGCGTGTLALMLKRSQPSVEVVGIDPDREILERARAKARDARLDIRFDEGFSTDLPYEEEAFDAVLSTLVLHHLTGPDKRQSLREIARVLRPGGELHVADWGRPSDPLMRVLFLPVRLGDGLEQTRDNAEGALPEIFAQGGLEHAAETGRLRTPFGTLSLYRARKPDA
jgi:ubiquinone/menaquinone biosynthesis C-methylase UbiE